MTAPVVVFDLYVSSFCGACARTRDVLESVAKALPGSSIREHNVAADPGGAEMEGIEVTPTVIMRDAAGGEFFRATGVPSAPQVLVAVSRHAR